jgi:hypothetical protein
MTRIEVRSKVGPDGVLHLDVPMGASEANREVRVIVEEVRPTQAMTQEEWAAWVHRMAGSWQGDFERPPQGEYETRDEL